ncbi:hypothetical protein BVX94_01425 [bacterium B17]|nr:hypothetical protein BVX94_01425 [bacterium B17]
MIDREKTIYSKLPFVLASFVVAAFAVWRLCLVTLLSVKDCIPLTTDDAFYYMNIALNIVNGKGVTFDGINLTNGFHPLWQMMLLPLYWLMPDEKVLTMRIILVVQLIIYLAAILLITRFVRKRYGYIAVFPALAFFFVSLYSNKFVEGMETPVQLIILISIIIYMSVRWCENSVSIGKDVCLGLMIGLMGLARLETIIFLVPCCFYILWHNCMHKLGFWNLVIRGCRVGIPAVAMVSPFLIWNMVNFGSFATVSSSLKSSFPHLSFSPELILRFSQWAIFVLICILYVLVLGLSKWVSFFKSISGKMTDGYRITILVYSCFVIMHFSLILLFSRWELAGWYFGFYILIIPLASGPLLLAVKDVFAKGKLKNVFLPVYSLIIVALFSFAVFMQVFSTRYRLQGDSHEFYRPAYFAALWARDNTPKTAVFATTDCGIFGYFSERSVVELDGIVNDYEYQEQLIASGLKNYLVSENVSYVREYAGIVPEDYVIHKYGIRSIPNPEFYDSVTLLREDEVYRSPYFKHGKVQKQQVIWKFNP